MAGSIESEAVFRQRTSELGLSSIHIAALATAGYQTMGRFAYCCGYVPGGNQDEKPLIEAVTAAIGADPGTSMAVFRRLYFECFTMIQSDLKLKLERSDEAPLRRLAVPERASRYEIQSRKLAGLVLRGELECSDSLIDEAVSQFDDNRLRFVKWERCIKKEAELDGIRRDPMIIPNQQGQLRITAIEQIPDADTSTELLLKFALTRRGLAYDQANLIEFSLHDTWVTKLFTIRLRAPPAGHQRVSLGQILTADRALFVRLAELTRAGIIPTSNGLRPIDLVIANVMCEQEIIQLLMPLPGPASSSGKRVHEPFEAAADQDAARQTKKGKKGKGKGQKGKAKGGGNQGNPPPLPNGLEGNSRTPEGSHICFGFNFNRCPESGKGGCSKGKHVCTKCFGTHPFVQCPTK